MRECLLSVVFVSTFGIRRRNSRPDEVTGTSGGRRDCTGPQCFAKAGEPFGHPELRWSK